MKHLTLKEQIERAKLLMEFDLADNNSDKYSDDKLQGISNEPDDATIEMWYKELNIDKLLDSGVWEIVERDGLKSKFKHTHYGEDELQFDDYNNMHVTYTIANWEGNDDRKIVIRFDVEIIDSWPEQKWGPETEPISAGYELGWTLISIEHPIEKVLNDNEVNVFTKLNPKFIKYVTDEVNGAEMGEYDGDF